MSLSCALLATSLHQWARRYIRLTQPARCSPEKRARMREFFADGLDNMHVPWAVEGLPTLLHLSLFLFFGGLVIFLFHVDYEVFSSVVCWIGLFSMVYGMITLLPLFRHDSPYHAPLSTPAWFLYTGIPYVTFKILSLITTTCYDGIPRPWARWKNLSDRYRRCMLGGVERAAEVTVSERLSEIDIRIFDSTISAMGDDISLEKFFEAIPGFVDSKLVHNFRQHLSDRRLDRLPVVAHGFLGRTWSSNLISDSEKLRRFDIVMNAMCMLRVLDVSPILHDILFEHWNEVPTSIEMGHTLVRWCTSYDQEIALYAQSIIGGILGSVPERNDSWDALAASVLGSAKHDFWDDIAARRDSVLLALLIRVTRPYIRSDDVVWAVLRTLCKLDITKTVPRLQHDFCTLWNEIVQETKRGFRITPYSVLEVLHRLYIALHQGGTDACPAASSDSRSFLKPFQPPFCNVAGHQSDSTAPNSRAVHLPIQSSDSPDASSRSPLRSGRIVSQQVEQGNITAGPSRLTQRQPAKIGEAFREFSAIPHTFPINSRPPQALTSASPPAADVCDDSLRDSHDQNQTIPMQVFHHQTHSLRLVPSSPDTASNPLEHGGD